MDEFQKRMRAARGYAESMSRAELAERLGVSESTVKRAEGALGDDGETPKTAQWWAERLARECGLPEGFFFEDMQRMASDHETEPARLARIEERLGRIEAALGGLVNYDELAARMQQIIRSGATPAATTPPAPEPSAPTSDPGEIRSADRPPREERG